ncbi:hypothetical protein OSTOST_03346, partial [Ostertagia ostertagi]
VDASTWRRRKGAAGSTPLKDIQSTSSNIPPSSPLQKSPVKRLLANPAFSSLFDTPEKGQPSAWGEISPMKMPLQKGASMGSPRKPLVHKEVLLKNVESLLLPTPEKRERKEVLDPFQPEEMPQKKAAAGPKKGMALAFSAEQGRIVKRAFKRSTPAGGNEEGAGSVGSNEEESLLKKARSQRNRNEKCVENKTGRKERPVVAVDSSICC